MNTNKKIIVTTIFCAIAAKSGAASFKAIIQCDNVISFGMNNTFCTNKSGGSGNPTVPNGYTWIDLFHHEFQILSRTTESEILSSDDISIANSNYNNSNVPQTDWTFTDIGDFTASGNNFDNINFMSSIVNAGSINLINNPNLDDISGLSNLRNADGISLTGTNVRDITPLFNLKKGNISLDSSNFNVKYSDRYNLDKNSDFCQGLVSGDIIIFGDKYLYQTDLCTTGNDWADFIYYFDHDRNNTYKDLSVFPDNIVFHKESEVDARTKMELTDNKISDSDLPSGVIPLTTLSGFQMKDENITHVNFLQNVTTVNNALNLVDMPFLTDINGLSNLTNVFILRLTGSNISDISALSKLQSGTVQIDSAIESRILANNNHKVPISEDFCVAIGKGDVVISGNSTSDSDFCYNDDPWFLNLSNHNSYQGYDSTSEFLSTDDLFLDNLGLNDSNVTTTLDIDNINNVYIGSNNFTHLNFLKNGLNINGQFNANDNINLVDISSLANVNFQDGAYIRLENTNVSDLTPLAGVTNARFYLSDSNVLDLAPLKNLRYGSIRLKEDLSSIVQSTTPFKANDPICIGLDTAFDLTIYSGASENVRIFNSDICEQQADSWIVFARNEGLNIAEDKATHVTSFNFGSKNYNDSDLPNENIKSGTLRLLVLKDSNITNLSFLSATTRIGSLLNLSGNNNITDFSGLGNLTYAYNYPSYGINLTGTNINKTGFSYLKNLTEGHIEISDRSIWDFNWSIPSGSPICNAINSGKVVIDMQDVYSKDDMISVCWGN